MSAVLFDFSGTLFRLEENETWLDGLTDDAGCPLDFHQLAELLRRMTAPTGQSVELDPDSQYAWDNRDLDPALHRRAYLEMLSRSGVSSVAQAEGLYRRLSDPGEWSPYPDTGEVLKTLAGEGIRIAVVSNIAFDIRPAFRDRGWDGYVDEFVLSFEVGAVKPDPQIFRIALDRLGVLAADALMVGDSAEADGGATAVGCDFALVQPLPIAERPNALLAAVAR
ncbi:HAD family hydrolase [Antrihabitans cavernicola]|uniref:HAD-IA family hydrolase n=1 Tax=Antrihabitans cavernicola TaxID=2495913 RepID=A0A5A7S964_9NOCA|nr:HAD-IA family hydrolase [Spelaeibacter cavernicola]KAA0022024.1 HAD-IA family hydrolase [Spelaeibacter cavernicola]